MEKFELELRHRPLLNQSIEEKHHTFLEAMQAIPAPWNSISQNDCSLPPQAGSLSTTTQFGRLLGKGFKGHITYALRSDRYIEDRSQYDDGFFIEFSGKTINYPLLVNGTVPALIIAFDAYRAAVKSVNLSIDDWLDISEIAESTGKDVDGRDGVYRVHAVNFWDSMLCIRAFWKQPNKIFELLSPLTPRAQLIGNGIYTVCAQDLSDTQKIISTGCKLKKLIES